MKFCCEKSVILENINIVMKAVSGKSAVPILEGILITADEDGNIKLLGNDLKNAIEATFTGDVSEPGKIVLNARLFHEIISKIPDGAILISSDDNFKTEIQLGMSRFEIYGMDPEEFPGVEENNPEKGFVIDKGSLKNAIKQIIFSISADEKRIALTGALFEVEDNIIKMVSLDGHRMSYRKIAIEPCGITESFIIPGKTLSDLLKIVNDNPGNAEIFFSDNRANFKIDNYVLYSNLIEGEFFKYEQILPNQCDITVITDTKAMTDSILRSSLVITSDVKSPLKLDITKDGIFMQSSTKHGKAQDMLNCEVNGGPLSIGFNHKFLIDALRSCDTDKIKLEFTSALNPLVIKSVDKEDFIYLILPLRLRNEG